MKKVLVFIFLCVVALCAHASYFEVQVPMSDKQTSTQMFGHQPLTTGHFGTTVHALDQSGRAYSPGQMATTATYGPHRAKKVDPDADDPDPNDESEVLPLGDTPWFFTCVCACVCAFLIYKRTRKQS